MRIAYFDCFAGASGDMILGALVDAGLSLERLQEELSRLRLTNYELSALKAFKKGISGSRVVVRCGEDRPRHLADIETLINASDLGDDVKQKSVQIFRRLARAEADVHGIGVEEVHFHEVGAVDAIIDVVGAVAGLELLEIMEVYCSPLHVGCGWVDCTHGKLPVPAPATAELVKGKPIYSTGIIGELLTPTGAAILTTLAAAFGPMPPMTLITVGYGAGTLDPDIPNLLRLVLGEAPGEEAGYQREMVAVAQATIDDMNPQMYDYIIERLFDMGALDVFLSPVQMKKNRPATLLTVLCEPNGTERFSDFLMRETTTIGVRWRLDNRVKAHRTIEEFQTPCGPVKFKVARKGQEIINVTPEYEDCKRLARDRGIPLKRVLEIARIGAIEKGGSQREP